MTMPVTSIRASREEVIRCMRGAHAALVIEDDPLKDDPLKDELEKVAAAAGYDPEVVRNIARNWAWEDLTLAEALALATVARGAAQTEVEEARRAALAGVPDDEHLLGDEELHG